MPIWNVTAYYTTDSRFSWISCKSEVGVLQAVRDLLKHEGIVKIEITVKR